MAVAEVSLPTTPFDSSAARNAFYNAFEERLLARPGVRAVAAATVPPLTGGAVASVRLTAEDSLATPRMNAPSVTTGYFETLDIPLVAGRRFDRRDTANGARSWSSMIGRRRDCSVMHALLWVVV
jgi:hypothetical protein